MLTITINPRAVDEDEFFRIPSSSFGSLGRTSDLRISTLGTATEFFNVIRPEEFPLSCKSKSLSHFVLYLRLGWTSSKFKKLSSQTARIDSLVPLSFYKYKSKICMNILHTLRISKTH